MDQFDSIVADLRGPEQQTSDETTREVFALFGLSVYEACVLERGVAQMLVTVWRPAGSRWTPAQFDAALQKHSRLSLGKLVKEVSEVGASPELISRLQRALEKRNWLTHHFWWDHAVDFMSEEGCTRMGLELGEMTLEFRGATDALRPLLEKWMVQRGLTQAIVVEEAQLLLEGR